MTFPRGLSAFPMTPTDHEGRVHTEALRTLVARLVTARVDSIGLLGSTGIYMYLTRDERRRLLDAAITRTLQHEDAARQSPPAPWFSVRLYLATGIVNSAPLAMLSGQRCMMLL